MALGTSFDAYVDDARRDGSRAFVGIETKLTDGFSRKVCDPPAYRRRMQGPWLLGARRPLAADERGAWLRSFGRRYLARADPGV